MKTFTNLVFKPHPAQIDPVMKEELIADGMNPDNDIFAPLTQAKITFTNGKSLSVVFGKMFYSNGVDTYEAMELNGDGGPRGHLTPTQVTEYMRELQV